MDARHYIEQPVSKMIDLIERLRTTQFLQSSPSVEVVTQNRV